MKTLATTLACLSFAHVQASIEVETGPQTGLKTWIWRDGGVSLRLVQRLPDQTRAYFLARGFSRPQADELAVSCFFGSMFRNDGQKPLRFDLRQWQVVYNEQRLALKTREYWARQWAEQAVPKAARVALNWSLLPTQQHFEPGDYNWGMTAYGLPPGTEFDLHIVVEIGNRPLHVVIADLQCAPEQLEE